MEKEGVGLEMTELRLGLPGDCSPVEKHGKKRVYTDISGEKNGIGDNGKTQNKSDIVGWPPVCSYRKKSGFYDKIYVKVSMDGTPFLRKIDLNTFKGYPDLAIALEKLFGCFGIGEALKDADSSEYIPIYEDKDADWMLIGDVPWRMFTESCKRLRIMKRSETKFFGLPPPRRIPEDE